MKHIKEPQGIVVQTEIVSTLKGGGTGPAGPVLAIPLFQGGAEICSSQLKNAWLKIGQEYEPWSTQKV